MGLNKPFFKIRNLFRTRLNLRNGIDSEIKYNLMLMQLTYLESIRTVIEKKEMLKSIQLPFQNFRA